MNVKRSKTDVILNVFLVCLFVMAVGMWGTIIALDTVSSGDSEGQVQVIATPKRTESAQHPDFIKEEYIPVVPTGSNIAGEARIDVNGYHDVYLKDKVNDGNKMGASYWEGAQGEYPNILTASYGESRTMHATKVCLCPQQLWGVRTQTFSVEISEDGESFTELLKEEAYQFDPDTANEVVLEFDAVRFQAVRLIFTDNTGAGAAQVAELEIYSE